MALGKNCISKARPCGLRTSKADSLVEKKLDFGYSTTTTTRTLGRKRVVVPNCMELSPLKTPSKKRIGTRLNSERDYLSSSTLGSPFATPTKKRFGSRLNSERDDLSSSTLGSPFATPTKKRFGSRLDLETSSSLEAALPLERSSLEALPQDILVRLLCCVDHDDLKQLFHVSQIVREATLIAKEWHFAFSTPSSKTAAIRSFGDLEDPNKFDMVTPNAPKRCGSYRPRISRDKLTDISVALFHSPEGGRAVGEELWFVHRNGGLSM